MALRQPPPAQQEFDGAGVRGNRVRPVLAGADPCRPPVGRLQRPFTFSVHRDDAATGFGRRIAQSHRGQPDHDDHCSADRYAARHTRWHLYGRVRPLRPAGVFLAGTYMAEYGRYDRLTTVVRFINDILLSAPSIVVGLFVYEVMVA